MLPVVNAEGLDLRTASTAVKRAAGNGPIVIQHAAHLAGLCAGLHGGELTIEGDGGDYLGVLNAGATIRVKGSVGRYLADNMTAGTVVVEGNAGYGVGAYCYGGTIVVDGDAGDFTAVMNKGATIVINGNVGNEVATYMLAGDLVITGDAGANLGNYLIRGNIYIAGKWASLGHNTLLAELTQEDVDRLRHILTPHGIEADPRAFTKIVRLSEKPFYKAKQPAAAEPVRA